MSKVTMGSKRNSVKVAEELEAKVNEATSQDAPLTEGKETAETGTRRQSTQAPQAQQERPATKKRLRGDRPTVGFWYLQDTEELQDVTAEPFNEVLGIKEIKVFDPSEAQWTNGTVAVVTLETVIGQIKGIQVLDSNRDNSIYIRLQSRSYERDGQKQYVNDLTLSRPVQAQILRYVDSLLVDAQ